jgi:hypothetical protein
MTAARLTILVGLTLCLGACSSSGRPSGAPASASAPAPRPDAGGRPGAVTGCSSNLRGDPLNCGACGHVCPSAERTLPVCLEGQCRQVCRVGYGECDGDPATVCETEVLRDPCHCRACGARCPAGQFCVAGMCQGRQDALVRTGPRAPASCDGWRMPAGGR